MKINIYVKFGIIAVLMFIFYYIENAPKLEDLANIAVVLGVVIALIVYITNSIFLYKQRISDNAVRYMEIHDRLFRNEFLKNNIQAMERGELKRTENDERHFNRLLWEVEKLAFLSKRGVVSKSINIYMFGWIARHIQPLITEEERNNEYWQVAIEFLDELKEDADRFIQKPKWERDKYLEKNHFFH